MSSYYRQHPDEEIRHDWTGVEHAVSVSTGRPKEASGGEPPDYYAPICEGCRELVSECECKENEREAWVKHCKEQKGIVKPYPRPKKP